MGLQFSESYAKMDTSVAYTAAVVLLVLLLLYRLTAKMKYKLPPGPRGWPVFGHFFSISPQTSHLDFHKISQEYGDVIYLNMAGAGVVVLNSAESIRGAFAGEETPRDAFSGRPDTFYVKYCDRGPSTAFMDFSDLWKLKRNFLVRTLKVFDDPNHDIQKVFEDQLSVAAQMVEDTDGRPFNIQSVVTPSLASLILILITGKRFELDGPEIEAAMEFDAIDTKMMTGQTNNILTLFPFLRHFRWGYGKLYQEHQRKMDRYLHYVVDVPKKTFVPGRTSGYVDELFRLQAENPWLTDVHIQGIARESISAGLGTTRATLTAFFLVILHQPEVMRKVQEETDAVIGRDRVPSIEDRGSMPYTQAAIMELLRYLSLVPTGGPHSTTHDVKFRDYFLPKDTMVFANQWVAHHDKDFWGDPWVYRPERFLDPDGRLLPVDSPVRKHWLPFGVGRRSCMGEMFARSRVFLFITTLLQRFDFRSCADEVLPSYDPRGFEPWIILQPPSYNLRAVPRQ